VAGIASDETTKRFLEELLSYPDVPSRWRMLDLDASPPPFLTVNYRWKNSTLRVFSALTTLGTPLDVALQELRIESFFPADEATRVVVNLSLPKTLSAHTNARIGKLIADRDQLEAAESKIGKCKRGRCRGRKCGLGPREFALAHETREES
jgi:hypothetical protein